MVQTQRIPKRRDSRPIAIAPFDESVRGPASRGDRAVTLLFLAAATIVAQLVNGYSFGGSDSAIYVPTVERILRPGTFASDYLFSVPFGDFAFWFPAVATLARMLPLEVVFFAGHLAAQFALFSAIYLLSMAIFRSRAAAALSVLLLIVPKVIGGTWNTTHDIYFVARDVAIPLAIFSLVSLYRGRLVVAGALAAASFLMHPVTGVSVVGVVVLSSILDHRRYPRRASISALGVMLLGVAPLLLHVLGNKSAPASKSSFLGRLAPDWLRIVRNRQSYLFLSSWTSIEALSIAAWAAILLGALAVRWWMRQSPVGRTRDSIPKLMDGGEPEWARHADRVDLASSRVLLACAGLLAGSLIFVQSYPIAAAVQLSLPRCLYLLVFLAVIYAAGLLWEGSGGVRRALTGNPGRGAGATLDRLMGCAIPLLLALMLMGNSPRLVVLATLPFLWWIAAMGWSRRSPGRAGVPGSTAWIVGGAFASAVALLLLHEFEVFGERGVFGLTTAAVAGVVVVGGELARRPLGSRTPRVAIELARNVLLVGVAILFLFTNRFVILRALSPRHLAERIDVPGRPLLHNDYRDVARWCRANTPPNALFLVPPWVNGFRVYSQRGIVGDWKDGAQAFYSREFAMAWSQRMADLDGYDHFDEKRLTEIGSKYGAAFALTRRSQQLALPVAYENDSFIVYSLISDGATSGRGALSVQSHTGPRTKGL